jgi:putative sigma-54 modulation protein
MKYQIVGKNIEVTEAIANVIKKKMIRLDRYFVINDEVTCRAVVRSYKVGAKVEITIFTKMMDFRAEVKDNDLYAAVDFAIDKLEGQMRKLKTRLDRSKRQGIADSLILENIESEKISTTMEEVVRTKSIFLNPMSIDDAITRMEALGHTFFVYLDIDDHLVSVLYRRNDGGYGIIQAENKIA